MRERKVKIIQNRPLVLGFSFALFALSFALICGCQEQRLYTDNRLLMGTIVETTSPSKEAAGIVFEEIRRIEGLLSKYDPNSDISKLNKSGRIKAAPETFFIINKAKEFWSKSDGEFDITVAPLMNLWGFTDKNYRLPERKEIKEKLRLVGSDKIILRDGNSMIEFKLSGMQADLGAIAKGYAIDQAADKLKKAGIRSCLINAGGQVYALGDKFGKPWKIAIRDPRRRGFLGYLELKNKSVATSGDYEQFFIKDSSRYSHILNPKTGYPADSKIASVTVIAPDGLTADYLSTAIFVMGRKKGEILAKRFSAEVKIIENNN